MAKYTYTIFDSNPNECGPCEWPSHCQVEIAADCADAALELVSQQLESEAAELYTSDGYEPGDHIHAIVWDAEGGRCVGQTVYTITAGDLGQDETDHQARLERAAALLAATDLGGDQWAYYAHEMGRYYVVDASDLESLCDYLDDEDPSISRDAYSHWCRCTPATFQPEGWEPGEAVAS